MTDNRRTFDSSHSSLRNNCDISFIRQNFTFRVREKTSRSESWKFLSFSLLVVVVVLIHFKMRICVAKLKLRRNFVDSFIQGYTERDMRSCMPPEYENRSKSVYLFFKSFSEEFHTRYKVSQSVEKKTSREFSHEDTEEVEFTQENEEPDMVRIHAARTIKKPKDPISTSCILPCLIILLLAVLTIRAMWDVARNDDFPRKKPSLSSISRRPSLRQNLLRKMSETNISGTRRPSFSRQLSQPELKRRLSIVKEAQSGRTDMARQYSAPASYITPDFRRGLALDYSSCEDDQMTPECKRRVRMIRRY